LKGKTRAKQKSHQFLKEASWSSGVGGGICAKNPTVYVPLASVRQIEYQRWINCTDKKHLEEIENLCADLTSSRLAATSPAIKTTGGKKAGKFKHSWLKLGGQIKTSKCKGSFLTMGKLQ